jgi:hypothetical protein
MQFFNIAFVMSLLNDMFEKEDDDEDTTQQDTREERGVDAGDNDDKEQK